MEKIDTRLSNGMRMILIHKKDFVQSFGMIGIPAGGNTLFQFEEELEGKIHEYPSGVAHFLEHQMFYLNGEDVTQALSDAKAGSNAYTSLDRTCYYIWTSEDPIKPYELLIDFVQTLEVSEKTVAKEKGIILSEYAMYNQQPESRILKEAMVSLYHNHPIQKDILGTQHDIEEMDPRDLQRFYKSYYDPSRLVFVGITGKEIEPIFEHLKEYEKKYQANFNHGKTIFFDEPESVSREWFEDEMDITEPYAALAIKLSPAPDSASTYLQDLMYTIWLDALFSQLNPQYSSWLKEGAATQSLYSEVDINTEHGYILIGSQSRNPERFFEVMECVLEEPENVPEEIFQALKNVEIASILRSQEQFEILASDLIATAFDDVEYKSVLENTMALDYETFLDFIRSQNLSNKAKLVLSPKTGK